MFDDSFDNTLEAYAACGCSECTCPNNCTCTANWNCGSHESSKETIGQNTMAAPFLYPVTNTSNFTVTRKSK